ncbi:hypothetical protein [Geomesophilobacter sediminis]|uniref:Phosphate starvation-inducible protein PsiF n=1 Tax=Geomesophilobacter sediminis TaxID=2798584 RepID=A0A8J7JEF2_9BACT|nr:hypothetical protein [Geomesophilobacter sediminis]MBJ6725978.1 hypothetical protein [Geomesophilobacter sediminis]
MNRPTLLYAGRTVAAAALLALLALTADLARAANGAPPTAQPPDPGQPLKCDGSARGGDGQGQMRGTSNCDRKAAAARTAARKLEAMKKAGLAQQGGKP